MYQRAIFVQHFCCCLETSRSKKVEGSLKSGNKERKEGKKNTYSTCRHVVDFSCRVDHLAYGLHGEVKQQELADRSETSLYETKIMCIFNFFLNFNYLPGGISARAGSHIPPAVLKIQSFFTQIIYACEYLNEIWEWIGSRGRRYSHNLKWTA